MILKPPPEFRQLIPHIRCGTTTRSGGISEPPWDSLNLGRHVGDDAESVGENRRRLRERAGGDLRFAWLDQVHGTRVVDASEVLGADAPMEADASFAKEPGIACVVMTADCLPVVFADAEATVVACAHAGWRGLAAGVLENTVRAMSATPERVAAWLGPAIGPDVFEVGDEVRRAFLEKDSGTQICFRPSPFHPDSDRWVADLYELARRRLERVGVTDVFGGEYCTYTDEKRFFSYRRDGSTGRMATYVALPKWQI